MGMYRKKPVVIEARQVNISNIEELEEWCSGSIRGIKLPKLDWVIEIHTLEGDMRASVGDWIIKGVNEEFYPCKDDIFTKTYEEVS